MDNQLPSNYTIIVPYYNNSSMLKRQIQEWKLYPKNVRIILVDDGSSIPAEDILKECEFYNLDLYRIKQDIPWNRGGARNLGTFMTRTDWIVHIDIDHILPVDCARALSMFDSDPNYWYRFERYRRGKADDTRKKDDIHPDVVYGKIKPHIDSYLCTKELFWKAGGYNEDFSGCLGGGSPFLKFMTEIIKPDLLPEEIYLEVYTKDIIKDASDITLSRDTKEFAKRKLSANNKAKNHIRFDWKKIDLS